MIDQSKTMENSLNITEAEEDESEEAALSESEKYWGPLQAYLKDTKRYPLLSREKQMAAFKKYRDIGDQETKRLLVVSNLRLVIKLAFPYYKYTNFPLVDLIQEGNLGLMRAVERYDPDRNVKFSHYASFFIKAYILKYITDNWSPLKFTANEGKRKLFRRLKKEKRRLTEIGIDPNAENVAQRLDVKVKDVRDMEEILGSSVISLDQPLTSKKGSSPRIDFIPSNIDIEEMVSESDRREKGRAIFDRFRKTLPKKERTVFDNRFYCEEALTLREIGEQFGLTRERIRQIEKVVYRKFLNFIKK